MARIRVLVDSYSERKRTGVIRLGYPSRKHLCLLFKRGELLNSYLAQPSAALEPLAASQWVKWVEAAGDAYTKIMSLSVRGLFVSKLLITVGGGTTENFSMPAQLSDYIASLEGKAGTTLLRVNWNRAMGGIFFSDAQDETHSVFLSRETVVDETGVHKNFSTWNEVNCAVEMAALDLSVDTWREWYLRRAFSEICRLMLSRFEVMTGRALVDSLVRLVSICAARNNLDIMISSRKVVDNEAFSSPADAAQSYREILTEMFSHFSSVVGSRLLSLTMQEIVASLPELERSAISTSELLPEGYGYASKGA
ncbi:MAG: hypothetical protein HY865_13715 [Chloroflexi bacterium]|nr:hypothetical protein [Chloroflexota bacterium]